ncbi:hypothetical protein B7463_g11676, partial [Scytalidium lignicola]
MRDRPFATAAINKTALLPVELEELEENFANKLSKNSLEAKTHQVVGATYMEHIGIFGRHVQAVYLFDQVLRLSKLEGEVSNDALLEELILLDQTLRDFLGVSIRQHGQMWLVYSGTVSMSIVYVHATTSAMHEKA